MAGSAEAEINFVLYFNWSYCKVIVVIISRCFFNELAFSGGYMQKNSCFIRILLVAIIVAILLIACHNIRYC